MPTHALLIMKDDVLFDLYIKLSHSIRDAAQDASHLETLAQWVKARQNAEDAVSAARDCLFEIAKSPELFVAAASRWVTSSEHALLGLALVHEVSVRHLNESVILAYDLSGIAEADAILTAFRLCAHAAAPAVCLGWVLSVVRDFPQSQDAARTASSLLSYLAEQLPVSTHQLLRADTSAFRDLPVEKQTLAHLNAFEAILSQLPVLREFAMTPEMRLAHASSKRSEHRDIHHAARKGSILDHIATKLRFKYATRTTIEMALGDEIRETSMTMDTHHLSMELPLSEGTDPLYGKLLRRKLARGLPK